MDWLDRLRYSVAGYPEAVHYIWYLFYVTSSPLRVQRKMKNCRCVGEQRDSSFYGNLDEWILIVCFELDKTPLPYM